MTYAPDQFDDAYASLQSELKRATTAAARAAEINQQTRVDLLRLHGALSIGAGILMLFTGAPYTFEHDLGLWVRATLGGLAMIAGILLITSVGYHRRWVVPEALGLVLVGLWDAAMALSIALAAFETALGVQFAWPWETLPIDVPRIYAVCVYSGLAAMVWLVHLRAVLQLRQVPA